MFDGIGRAMNVLLIFCVLSLLVFVPLAAWKVIELLYWFFNHLEWK